MLQSMNANAKPAPFCADTYHDALTWDRARIEREQKAICAYLAEHWATMSEANRGVVLAASILKQLGFEWDRLDAYCRVMGGVLVQARHTAMSRTDKRSALKLITRDPVSRKEIASFMPATPVDVVDFIVDALNRLEG